MTNVGGVSPGSFNIPPSQPTLKTEIENFIKFLENLNPSHLDDANKLNELSRTIINIDNFLSTDRHTETHEILQHILNQPLAQNTSLLAAAKSFRASEMKDSSLVKLLQTYHQYPGPKNTLIAELDILKKELYH